MDTFFRSIKTFIQMWFNILYNLLLVIEIYMQMSLNVHISGKNNIYI